VSYAIILVHGKQYRVSEGEVVRVPSFTADPGATVQFDVMARGQGDCVEIGTPLVDGASVTGTVVEHGRERKIIVFKKKRKKQYKRTHGHRQNYTAVRIDSIGGTRSEASDNSVPAAE
jgi:large subunit ribosomal protein L21